MTHNTLASKVRCCICVRKWSEERGAKRNKRDEKGKRRELEVMTDGWGGGGENRVGEKIVQTKGHRTGRMRSREKEGSGEKLDFLKLSGECLKRTTTTQLPASTVILPSTTVIMSITQAKVVINLIRQKVSFHLKQMKTPLYIFYKTLRKSPHPKPLQYIEINLTLLKGSSAASTMSSLFCRCQQI